MDSTIIVAVITTTGLIINSLISGKTNKKIEKIKDIKNELKEEIEQNQRENDKTYLTDFLSDVENGQIKTEIQKQRLYEVYTEYLKLNGNSYIHNKFEELRKKEMI